MRHIFVSGKPDNPDPTVVSASEWNAAHVRLPNAISTNTVGTSTDDWILATGGAGGITYTLPPSPAIGQSILAMRADSGAGLVQVLRSGAQTIISLSRGTDTAWDLVSLGQYAEFTFDGTNWWVTDSN